MSLLRFSPLPVS